MFKTKLLIPSLIPKLLFQKLSPSQEIPIPSYPLLKLNLWWLSQCAFSSYQKHQNILPALTLKLIQNLISHHHYYCHLCFLSDKFITVFLLQSSLACIQMNMGQIFTQKKETTEQFSLCSARHDLCSEVIQYAFNTYKVSNSDKSLLLWSWNFKIFPFKIKALPTLIVKHGHNNIR